MATKAKEATTASPVKRGPGRPRKTTTTAAKAPETKMSAKKTMAVKKARQTGKKVVVRSGLSTPAKPQRQAGNKHLAAAKERAISQAEVRRIEQAEKAVDLKKLDRELKIEAQKTPARKRPLGTPVVGQQARDLKTDLANANGRIGRLLHRLDEYEEFHDELSKSRIGRFLSRRIKKRVARSDV